MKQIFAIFDFEGTLSCSGGVFWREVVKHSSRRITGLERLVIESPGLILATLRYKTGLMDQLKLRDKMTKKLAILLKDFTEEEVAKHARVVSEKCNNELRPRMKEVIDYHKEKGHILVVLSGMFQPYLEAVAERLEFKHAIGTQLELNNNRYTGRLYGTACFAGKRVEMLKEHIKAQKLEIDYDNSYAYGDALVDSPVLETVGNPSAVYPDSELKEHALRIGWKIIE